MLLNQVATLYNIDSNRHFVPRPDPLATARARLEHDVAYTYTATLDLSDVLTYGTHLGHGDVTRNLGDLTM